MKEWGLMCCSSPFLVASVQIESWIPDNTPFSYHFCIVVLVLSRTVTKHSIPYTNKHKIKLVCGLRENIALQIDLRLDCEEIRVLFDRSQMLVGGVNLLFARSSRCRRLFHSLFQTYTSKIAETTTICIISVLCGIQLFLIVIANIDNEYHQNSIHLFAGNNVKGRITNC